MKNYNSPDVFIKEVVIPYLSGDENKPISSVCYDLEGVIIFASNVFARSFGYQSNKEVIGLNIQQIQPTDDIEFIAQIEKNT